MEELRGVGTADGKPDVGRIPKDHLLGQKVGKLHDVQADPPAKQLGAKLLQGEGIGNAVAAGNADTALFLGGHLAQPLLDGVVFLHQAAHFLQSLRPKWGEDQAAFLPGEEGALKLLLQPVDRLAQGLGGEKQTFGCGGDPAAVADCNEIFHLVQVHNEGPQLSVSNLEKRVVCLRFI